MPKSLVRRAPVEGHFVHGVDVEAINAMTRQPTATRQIATECVAPLEGASSETNDPSGGTVAAFVKHRSPRKVKSPLLPQRNRKLPSASSSDSSPRRWIGAASVAMVFVVLGASTTAGACPRCADGQAARREVIADGFSRNLATSLLPFLIVGAVSAGTHAIGRRRAPKNAEREVS